MPTEPTNTGNGAPTQSRLRRILGAIGPGLITAAVVVGPGSVTVSTKAGALEGCSLLWVLASAGLMMIAFTYLGAKIGLVLDQSLLTTTAWGMALMPIWLFIRPLRSRARA